MEGVETWLSSQVADFFDAGVHKLIPRYDKCLNSGGDYVESSLSMHVFLAYNIFFLIACFVNNSPEVTFRITLV
jgi:hypothetical protein